MSLPIPNNVAQRADPYYRYKRDAVQIEERKNGLVWINFATIMKQLRADANHFCDKFRRAMNQNVRCEQGMLIFKSMPICIEDLLEAYIAKYVLCQHCGLPELGTVCNADDEATFLGCRACGHVLAKRKKPSKNTK